LSTFKVINSGTEADVRSKAVFQTLPVNSGQSGIPDGWQNLIKTIEEGYQVDSD